MTLTDVLAALVQGRRVQTLDVGVDEFCAAAHHHGVLPMIADSCRADGLGLPADWCDRVRDLSRLHAAHDLIAGTALKEALAACASTGVQPILFKGAHLAYALYARPDLRPRADTDVLIPATRHARDAVHRALRSLGYDTRASAGGNLVMTQRAYAARRGGITTQAIDVHWRVANPPAFARLLSYEEALAEATPLPMLGPNVSGFSVVHALLVACVHRVAHHRGSNLLIWFCDIDRLGRRVTEGEWTRFVGLAIRGRVAAICLDSLTRAETCLSTPVPLAVRAALADAARTREPSARFLQPRSSMAAEVFSDWRALSSVGDRLRFAREQLLPPADYMREVHAPDSRAPLAWLYVRRALQLRRWSGSR